MVDRKQSHVLLVRLRVGLIGAIGHKANPLNVLLVTISRVPSFSLVDTLLLDTLPPRGRRA